MIWEALWFFAPAGWANVAPVFASRIPGLKQWNTPMDLGKTYEGKRIFGTNKTWRGLVSGIVLATVVVGLQKYFFTRSLFVLESSWFDYRPGYVWLLGPLFGAGALLADAIESFFKRQRGVLPGHSWFPFDQIDYIIGGCLASLLVVRLPLGHYVWLLVVWFGVHIVFSYIAYLVGLKENPI